MNLSSAWQTTRACIVGSIGTVVALVYLAAIIITGLVLAYAKTVSAGEALLAGTGIAAFFWWAFISSRLLKVLRDTDQWMLPSPMRTVGSAILLQMMITIIVPATLHALLGKGFFIAAISLTAVAACGLLFMLLPRYLGISMSLVPTLFNKLVDSRLLPATDTAEFFVSLIALTLILIAIAGWRFYRLRRYEGDTSRWSTPMALMPDGANGWGEQTWSKSASGQLVINGISFEPAIDATTSKSSALAMRTYLGVPFMPLTKSSRTKQILLMGFAYLVLPVFMAYSISKDGGRDISTTAAMAAFWVCLIGLGITFSAALVRLRSLYTRDNTELAELALLPAWNGNRNARELLTRVILRYMGYSLLLPIIFAIAALAFVETKDHDGFMIIAALYGTCLLMGAGYGMNIISGSRSRVVFLALVFIAAFVIAMIQLLFSVQSRTLADAVPGLPVWLVFLAIALAYFHFSLRPFLNRAHPFLRN